MAKTKFDRGNFDNLPSKDISSAMFTITSSEDI